MSAKELARVMDLTSGLKSEIMKESMMDLTSEKEKVWKKVPV